MRFADIPFAIVSGALGLYSRGVMFGLNDTDFRGEENLRGPLLDKSRRARGQGLVTVMNHYTPIDDPAAVAVFLKPLELTLGVREHVRWTMCATDRCFKNPVVGQVLRWGKVLPIERGKGVHQPCMDAAVELLDSGEWMHIFPEGRRSRTGRIQTPLRVGVGRLVADARVPPVIVPIYHRGIDQVLPRGAWVPLTAGKRMLVMAGKPIDVSEMVSSMRAEGRTEADVYSAVTAEIERAMLALEAEADRTFSLDGEAPKAAIEGAGSPSPKADATPPSPEERA